MNPCYVQATLLGTEITLDTGISWKVSEGNDSCEGPEKGIALEEAGGDFGGVDGAAAVGGVQLISGFFYWAKGCQMCFNIQMTGNHEILLFFGKHFELLIYSIN